MNDEELSRLGELLADRVQACGEAVYAARKLARTERALLGYLREPMARIYADWRPWVGAPVVRVSCRGENFVPSLLMVYHVTEDTLVVSRQREELRIYVRRNMFEDTSIGGIDEEGEAFELFFPLAAFNNVARHWFGLQQIET